MANEPRRDAAWARPPVPPDEERRLAHLAELQVLDTLPQKEFDDLAALAAYVCGTPMALISLIDRDRQWFKARHGVENRESPRDVSFCAHAICEPDRMLLVEDARQDARFAGNPDVVDGLGIRFYAGEPLRMEDGVALGTLCVIDREPRTLTPEQQRLLQALAREVVLRLRLTTNVRHLQRSQEALRSATVARPLMRALVDELIRVGHVPPTTLIRIGADIGAAAPADGLQARLEAYAQLGLGRLRLAQESGDRWTFEGHDLFETRDGARSTTCYLALGFLQAAVARSDAEAGRARGSEVACVSRGDAACRFVVARR